MRYYLIDKVTEFVPGTRARGIKSVTLSDDILEDHFADDPMMPVALILEAATQLGGFLIYMSFNKPNEELSFALPIQARANFYKPCRPGDRLEIVATLSSRQDSSVQVSVDVEVEGKRVTRAELTFILTSAAVNSARRLESRRSLYKIWTRDLPSCVIP